MTALAPRPWLTAASARLIAAGAETAAALPAPAIAGQIEALAARSRDIHERDCFNLNPATNVLNPRAEAILSAGLGSRPSLGHPGDKYETGLEAIEEIEIIAAELAAEVFKAKFVEFRVASGALANLYGFMALARPGDAIIAPPSSIGGHVTHHEAGAAGLRGLEIHDAPVDADGYTIDAAALADLARRVKPKIITIGGSLNLFPHPVAPIRAVADEVGAKLMFDAAHQCGIIAGGAWPNPLDEGADLMTMSTYKSLGGPAGGLLLTNDPAIAERLDAIAFPGLTANFDVAKTAALAITLADWKVAGADYAARMIALARALAAALAKAGLPVFAAGRGFTRSHQFALEAARWGGGQAAARHIRKAGFLACGIGLPGAPVEGDMNGLRIGTPELARWGVEEADIPEIADLLIRALTTDAPETLAAETKALRSRFDRIGFLAEPR
ncbi:aminotransferase class I/II-fold pyridoxal phosphate-dependent enzyme [Pikeienuella sp. HZG-20]|uniref:aminotransferase class I/II-fold pyridoxal phosphate-dependent enzyme n=1 Tax=Paludibacillus litoralis TaxID=3133267 RepID=UPI0030EB36ED